MTPSGPKTKTRRKDREKRYEDELRDACWTFCYTGEAERPDDKRNDQHANREFEGDAHSGVRFPVSAQQPRNVVVSLSI
ncbi:hypothetical protein LMTR13_12550 [Bradyrhizobium icense]|uniref:Uncharacterized protein n=1 Tax=Bradyrhizobium icense TaxID=1274631 RepID=A0A1B1UDR6_9BRAD|nr:hypothetical protein LMTR13_12550 [Bradyrhizobium icense]